MILDNGRKGQQEMVGFVLIVVLVMIGLMVFLIISFTGDPKEGSSLEVDTLLNSLMSHTTECATVFEPDYDTFEDLFKSCHQGKTCANLGKDSCEYLEESLSIVLEDSIDTMANVNQYVVTVSEVRDDGNEGILQISDGNCTGTSKVGAGRSLVSGGDSLRVELSLCIDE